MNVRYTSGPAVERAGDLAAILTALDDHDVLFIDEIHRLNRAVEEILYPAMEDYALDVMIGKGPRRVAPADPQAVHGRRRDDPRRADQRPAAGPLRGHLPARLLRGGRPHRDRPALGRDPRRRDHQGRAHAIARRGRGTPRVVNRLLKRTRDHAQVHGDGRVDAALAEEALGALEIDEVGLDTTDRKLMAAIAQKFGSGPVGVAAVAALLAEEVETIEDVYEPYLLRLGFMDRTPQGRILTEGGGPTSAATATRSRRPAGRSRTCRRCGTATLGTGSERGAGRDRGGRRRVTAPARGEPAFEQPRSAAR